MQLYLYNGVPYKWLLLCFHGFRPVAAVSAPNCPKISIEFFKMMCTIVNCHHIVLHTNTTGSDCTIMLGFSFSLTTHEGSGVYLYPISNLLRHYSMTSPLSKIKDTPLEFRSLQYATLQWIKYSLLSMYWY